MYFLWTELEKEVVATTTNMMILWIIATQQLEEELEKANKRKWVKYCILSW